METEDELSENKLYAFNQLKQEYRIVTVNFLNTDHNAVQYNYVGEPTYYAPTLALVIKWLRDKHNYYIKPYRLTNKFALESDDSNSKGHSGNFDTWEEAESHGINLALEKIKNGITK